MASENKTRACNSQEANREVQLHPELLMAARDGSWEILSVLLNKEDAPAVPLVVDDVEAEETTANMHVDKAAHATEEAAATIGLDPILHEVAPAVPIVVVDVEAEETTANKDVDKAAHPTEKAATIGLDSILHEVASSGDGEVFLKSADVIYGWAKHLLDARNKMGDTPLQCAVRAGNIKMVRHLIGLARNEDGRDDRVKVVLRNQNKQGETALHEALRLSDKKMVDKMVEVLIWEDAELARLVHSNGTSPLYLAVMLGHNDIAEKLYRKDKELSYSGPDGQNVLHVAVLRSKDMTEKLLNWNKDLTKTRDETTGSTPLHIAASWGRENKKVIKLLLHSGKSSAFQKDNSGSFPIHVAAVRMLFSVVRILLKKNPSCAGLQDAKGKTFLHIAVEKERSFVVGYACWKKCFAPILNIQDNDGNTALHLAADVGNQWSFYHLIQNPHVHLNLLNSKGQTPMDIAWMHKPQGIIYGLDPRLRINLLLKGAGAKTGTYRWDWFVEKYLPKTDQNKQEKNISDSTQTIGIGSVLIVTVAFAAAFTIPGGFRADDKPNGGKATLAGDKVFRAFIIANTLALVCSGLATMSVMFAGVVAVDIRTRMSNFVISTVFLYCSAKSLVAAFLFGLYAVLPPDASIIAYISCAVAAPFLILDAVWYISMLAIGEVMLLKRLGCIAWVRTFSPSRIPNVITEILGVLGMPLPPKKDGGQHCEHLAADSGK